MKQPSPHETLSQKVPLVLVTLAIVLFVTGLLVNVTLLQFLLAPLLLVFALLTIMFPKSGKGLVVFAIIIFALLACYGLFIMGIRHFGLFGPNSRPGDF